MSKNEKLDTKRHSLAHIMAASIQDLFPEAKFGVGPVIEHDNHIAALDLDGCIYSHRTIDLD